MTIDKWVAKGGNNQNPGTKQLPWQTIQWGVDQLAQLLSAAAATPGGRGTAVLHVVSDPIPYFENVRMIGANYSDITVITDRIPSQTTIVDGGGAATNRHVFHIEDATGVVLEGLAIQNGNVDTVLGPDKGAGVLAQASQVNLIGCRFENNHTKRGGGFAYDGCRTGKLSVVMECELVNNHARPDLVPLGLSATPTLGFVALGGAGGGGAILNSADIHVISSRFDNNVASPTGGGGLFIGESSNVRVDQGCVFTNNRAPIGVANPKWASYWEVAKGGGIYVSGCSDVPASIRIGGVTPRNSFTENHADEFGGAIAAGENSYMEIVGNDIRSNHSEHEGGGVSVVQQPWSEFLALQTIDPLRHEQLGRTVKLDDNLFVENRAQHGGGGLFVSASSAVVVAKTRFEKNHALAGTGGGGIHVTWNSLLHLTTENMLVQNDATAAGGGVFARNSHVHVDDGNRFERNTAGSHGGGIYVFTGTEADAGIYDYLFEWYLIRAGMLAADVHLVGNNRFDHNTSGAKGGAIYCEVFPLKYQWFPPVMPIVSLMPFHLQRIGIDFDLERGGHLTGNTASQEGGALYLAELHKPLIAFTAEIRENTSGTSGGGGCLLNCTEPEIVHVQLIQRNRTTNSGGGFCLIGCKDPIIKTNRFGANVAPAGSCLELVSCTASGMALGAAYKTQVIADNGPSLSNATVALVP